MILFYTPSHTVPDAYASVIHDLRNKVGYVRYGVVNCGKYKALCDKYNVRDYPNFGIAVNGDVSIYNDNNGGINARGLSEFIGVNMP